MPNVKSAIKRVKKSAAQRERNRRDRSRLRTAVKRARSGSREDADLQAAASLLDRAARKGLIHPNKAARDKSRLARLTRSGAAPAEEGSAA